MPFCSKYVILKSGDKMKYKSIRLKKAFEIKEIVTIHYFEYENDYKYIGEKHNFWEFVYVDKGEIEIEMGENKLLLKQGNIAFHKPMEYHNLRATGNTAPNIIVISFKCDSPSMEFFEKRILPLTDIEKTYLATIIREAKNSFSSSLNDTYLTELKRNKVEEFGSEQLILLAIENLLISLYRNFSKLTKKPCSYKHGISYDIVYEILEYMQENISNKLTIKDITDTLKISKTGISTLFKENMGDSIISYFNKMKIDTAKVMIREKKYNMSQIANYLGYDSIHIFSRSFKRITGMTPTEYKKSVKIDAGEFSDK